MFEVQNVRVSQFKRHSSYFCKSRSLQRTSENRHWHGFILLIRIINSRDEWHSKDKESLAVSPSLCACLARLYISISCLGLSCLSAWLYTSCGRSSDTVHVLYWMANTAYQQSISTSKMVIWTVQKTWCHFMFVFSEYWWWSLLSFAWPTLNEPTVNQRFVYHHCTTWIRLSTAPSWHEQNLCLADSQLHTVNWLYQPHVPQKVSTYGAERERDNPFKVGKMQRAFVERKCECWDSLK